MKAASTLAEEFRHQAYQDLLTDIYMDPDRIGQQTERYIHALMKYEQSFGPGEVEIYSAPGRSEIGGNHTDHQHGEVLAASINRDAIAVAGRTCGNTVTVISDGSEPLTVHLSALSPIEAEQGSTAALIRGVLKGLKERGYTIGGFQAYITSDVLIGAGLSSSAAFETLIGTVVSGLYNNMNISAIEIALVGQYAENVYFGKPCGLMDQMACSVGNLVHIDFADPDNPVVEKIDLDLTEYGYSLCIVDTRGSHADLTDEYAAIPLEMKQAAGCFHKEVLRDVSREELLGSLPAVRSAAGDRAALRAIHFVMENERVKQEIAALQNKDFPGFLRAVRSSGDSSFKYLQNVYSSRDTHHQNMSLALAVSDVYLGENGVSRVHGGGFAGTIQAFVQNAAVMEYRTAMDLIFGEGSCSILKIRRYGGMKVL